MKTRVIAASAIAALLLVGVAAVAFAHSGVTFPGLSVNVQGPHGNQNSQGSDNDGNETADQDENEYYSGHSAFTVNQTLTLSGLSGHSNLLHNETDGDDPDEGASRAQPSTGNFTFTVTGASDDEVNLTISSGFFTILNQTLTVLNGTLTLNGEGESGSGSGTASGNAMFTIHVAGIHGNISSGALVGAIKLDVTIGTSEYHVLLGTRED